MATFTYLGTTDWNYYFDFGGGTVLTKSSTSFQYLSTAGLTITLHGTGFTYDAAGVATAGAVTGMDVVKTGTLVGQYTGLTVTLTAFETLALGHTSGQANTAVNTVSLYTLLQSGDDIVTGNDLSKTLVGNAGNDTIFGNGGDDWMQGGAGVDRYFGGTGRNGVYFDGDSHILTGVSLNMGKTANNILNDGYGNTETATDVQMIGGSNLADRILGGASSETLYGHGGNDTINGGDGNDYIQGGDGLDALNGGAGNDWLSFSDAITGAHGVVVDLGVAKGQANVLDDGFGHAETALGFEYVAGTVYGDQITAGAADMVASGNDGNDSLLGGKGNDVLYGGAGNDTLIGGDGFDFVQGGKGTDSMVGGGFNDYLLFTDIDATGHGVVVNLGKASHQVTDDGYGNTETAKGFERLEGSSYGDRLTGSTGENLIWGFAGNDSLYGGGFFDQLDGGDGNDRLYGGSNIDTLIGGKGDDTLTGGSGDLDSFYFADIQPGRDGVDHITDFQAGTDVIVISTSWAADLAPDRLSAAQFLSAAGASAATTALQRVIYDSTSGSLYFDADGTGSDPAFLLAILDNHAALSFAQISAIDSTILPP